MTDWNDLSNAILKGDADNLKKLVQQALDAGHKPNEIMNSGLIAGMNIVGGKMEAGDMFIPEVLLCARTMSAGLEVLKPLMTQDDKDASGSLVIGTVQGDLHDIGKNLVSTLLSGAGYNVIDLGTDVAPERFVEVIKTSHAVAVGLSALLTTTMPKMAETIAALKKAGIRDRVKVMVGGAPVTKDYADKIGADGYAPDAGSAVKVAKSLF